jgi:hypothetical protein
MRKLLHPVEPPHKRPVQKQEDIPAHSIKRAAGDAREQHDHGERQHYEIDLEFKAVRKANQVVKGGLKLGRRAQRDDDGPNDN